MRPRSLVIIGAGISGICAAYYALREGLQVTVLERDGPETQNCSFGNAGMITPSHFVPLAAPGMVEMGLRMLFNPRSPFAIRPSFDPAFLAWLVRFWRSATPEHVAAAAPNLLALNMLSRSLYEELAADLGVDFGLTQRGLLMLCKTQEALDAEVKVAQMARKLGLEAEVLDPAGLAAADPDVRMDVPGGVFFPQDCHLTPNRLMPALREAVERGGGKIRWHTPVSGFRTEGGRIRAAVTAEGEVDADAFLITGGSWSARIVRSLRVKLPLQAGKGYSITLPKPAKLPQLCSILLEARIAVTPMGEALRFAGTMELAGLDLSVSPRRVEGMVRSIPDYLPDYPTPELQNLPLWSGLRPCSPDGLPYLGRAKRWENLWIGTGHAMMGLSLGPATGRVLTQDLLGEAPAVALKPFAVDRFG
jgi:D-amino-acid dehydrogenase